MCDQVLLSREVAIDGAEHARASEFAHAHLLAALGHYRAALSAPAAAGSGSQLRTVFRVTKIWLDNAGSAEVNHHAVVLEVIRVFFFLS